MGRNVRTDRYNGTLPATTAPGRRVLDQNDNRVGAVLINRGAGAVYIAEDQKKAGDGFRMDTNDSLNFIPFGAPTDALFAWGDAGHDLRILEIIGPAVGREIA